MLRFGLWPCYCRIVGGLLKAKLEVNAVANMPEQLRATCRQPTQGMLGLAHRTFSATATMPKKESIVMITHSTLTPKVAAFLRGQAQDIQALAKHREDITVIRVFVPSRIVAALGVKN